MNMRYAAIASGSNGNCYYIASGKDAILIDVGINTKHVELRMANLGIDPKSIKAIFITHEHTDHIRGLSVFCKRYQVPVYITAGSYQGSRLHLPEHLVHIVGTDAKIEIGSLSVYGIPKYHDAREPCSFMVHINGVNVAVLTDLGRACNNVERAIANADILMLESNFDEEMLQGGRYSYYLKNRISGGMGHMSNRIALESFLAHRTPRLRHLILTHLSGENNTVDLVQRTFCSYCEDIKLSVATRYQETELFDWEKVKHVTHRAVSSDEVSIQTTIQTKIIFPEAG